MQKLEDLEKLLALLHKLQNVKRVARIPDETEYRSTAEHTLELVFLAWYVLHTDKLDLDSEKVLKYALAHDLIEAYAGDTPMHDMQAQKSKKDREERAVKQIEQEFPEFADLVQYIHAYENREDEESKFVYALDKLIDPLNASMEKTQSIWKDEKLPYQQMRDYKDNKIATSAHIEQYWKELVKKLDDNRDFFFDE